MFKSIQKIFLLSIMLISLSRVSFGQSIVSKSQKNVEGNSFKTLDPKAKKNIERNNFKIQDPKATKNDRNTSLLINHLKSARQDIDALNQIDFSFIETSFNHFLKANKLNRIIPSFKYLIKMDREITESICKKYGTEMKDICIQIKNNLNTLK